MKFRDYFNGCHPNMSFSHEVERDGNVFREEGQFSTNVYCKPTFSGVYTHFESFCQQLISLAWFIPLHIDVFEFVLIDQNSTRNSGFLKVSF